MQTAPDTDAALAILRETFGYEDFRGRQREIIDAVAGGHSALALMPTGGGKSLCYQIPALLREGTGVVVSPLIALMQDQVEALRHYGVRAACLHSGLAPDERERCERDLAAGELDLLYVAPERLLGGGLLPRLERQRIALFAIDEAHCVSQWGHDFRPEYLQLGRIAERFPDVPLVALTATADARTRGEIERNLLPDGAETFVASFDRPNIRYRVRTKERARQQILEFIRDAHPGESGIIYCMSRRATEDVAEWLMARDVNALPYHAGLPASLRETHQRRFLREDGIVMVATVAFGMGIDKPDVRFVVHMDLPKSLEAYYQETGRAGRDGLPAEALLLYGTRDVYRLRAMLEDSEADERHKRLEGQRLEALLGFCEHTGCRRQALLGWFDERHPGECGNCDNCLDPPETWDATEAAQKLLSCIYRTGQRFGANHIIEVLTGGTAARIGELGHDRLSTYGIGRDLARGTWQSLIRQMLAQGLVQPDPEGHGGLRLAEACRPLLRGEQHFVARRDPARPQRRSAERGSSAQIQPADRERWDALRQCRREIAEAEGVPPYVVFHDATLMEMLWQRPGTLEELAGVSGVGRHKLEKYGEAFLQALARAS
ncbi:DNA helicase RecQ [Arhodomonas sp. KWT2]|uniref:DNA helicase RecQ n=3 Tax=unclassified Arhodomonas TaxID=2621637 RepID=UPI0035C0ACE0